MSIIRTVRRGKIEETDAAEFLRQVSAAETVLVDIGTGDGKFPYRMAKENPDTFCIGIDPVAKNLIERSGKIGRKPARGGVNNLAYAAASLETIPPEFSAVADRLTVNFPWGSLLRGVLLPEDEAVSRLSEILKPGGRLDVLINMQVFDDEALRKKLELPVFNLQYVDRILIPAYKKRGLHIKERVMLAPGELPERTSWGRHLSVGSGRAAMAITAEKDERE